MARLTILMATYNGERFLKDQLDSFLCQTYADWDLWVSDDGSSDETKAIVKDFADVHRNHNVTIVDGPRRGFASNFLSLACRCTNQSSYFAFADQDDIWRSEKLERALNCLKSVPENVPALYCSRTEIVDSTAKPMTPAMYSKLINSPPTFGNALVQCIAGGNTMVFNREAKKLIENFGGAISVPSHDWWLYLLVSGTGGVVYYDSTPMLMYRQHCENLVGSNCSLLGKFKRLIKFFDGKYKKDNERNVYYLTKKEQLLSMENRKKLIYFTKARKTKGLNGLIYLKKSCAVRSDWASNLALRVGIVIGII